MSVEPPRLGRQPPAADPLGVLRHEIAGEQASALARAARRVEAALAALAAAADPSARAACLAEAGEAVWALAVQREAMGLRNTEQMLRDYRVPPEVRVRMGILPAAKRRSRG